VRAAMRNTIVNTGITFKQSAINRRVRACARSSNDPDNQETALPGECRDF